MRPKSLVLLLLALGCGLVAAIGVAQVLATKGAAVAQGNPDLTNVVVAAKDISLGTAIDDSLLKVEQWPKDMVRKGMLGSLEEAKERRTRSTILEGMPLMDNYLSPKGELSSSGAAQLIPKGLRSVPVRVDVVSGGGSIVMPGDRVDVVVMVKQGRDFDTSITKTIVQDVKVFAVDDIFSLEGTEAQKSIQAQTISLLLTPEQTEQIMMAADLGSIRLALRNPEDRAVEKLRGVEPEMLLGGTAKDHNRDIENAVSEDQVRSMIEREVALRTAQSDTVAAPPTNQFVMRVISGGEVSEVTLETPVESETSSSVAAGDTSKTTPFSIWSVMPSYGKGNEKTPVDGNDVMETSAPADDNAEPTEEKSTEEATSTSSKDASPARLDEDSLKALDGLQNLDKVDLQLAPLNEDPWIHE